MLTRQVPGSLCICSQAFELLNLRQVVLVLTVVDRLRLQVLSCVYKWTPSISHDMNNQYSHSFEANACVMYGLYEHMAWETSYRLQSSLLQTPCCTQLTTRGCHGPSDTKLLSAQSHKAAQTAVVKPEEEDGTELCFFRQWCVTSSSPYGRQ